VLGGEIAVRISEKRFGGRYKFGVGVALSKCGAAGRRCHSIDIRIVGKSGMRVMVKDWYLFDLWEQSLVDLLHVVSREWTRLSRSEYG
jgi:hypothetical protein